MPPPAEQVPVASDASSATAGRAPVSPDREARLAAGVAELQRWLADQVRTGLAALDGAGAAPFTALAARMVDAGAPGLAASVRGLATTLDGQEGWPDRLLEGMALLHLAAGAHGRLASLPPGLAASVRREIGLTVSREEVLATPAVRDAWQVLGVCTVEEGSLAVRRVWLRGAASGRWAMLETDAGGTAPLWGPAADASLALGTCMEADAHFYPGAAPLLAVVGAVVGARHDDGAPPRGPAPVAAPGTPSTTGAPDEGSVARARAARASALDADPWTRSWPAVVEDLVPTVTAPRWRARDGAGTEVALLGESDALWNLLGLSGGHPTTTVVEVEPDGLRPLSVIAGGEVVTL